MRNVLTLICLLCIPLLSFAESQPKAYSEESIYDKPLMERYVLDELKALRTDYQALEKNLIREITDRELAVAEHSMGYANTTVTFFFYVIAGIASLIAFVGWQSLREIKANTKRMAEEQLTEITKVYEKKFQALERELKRKTNIISQNNREIELINEIHTLWLRAQNMQTPEQKMEVYDEILQLRPGDLEALTYKADAAMEIREFHWALSLCNRVLEVDDNNAHALYQRACAYSCLGAEEQAINDLETAISITGSLVDLAQEEPDFELLHGNDRFEALILSQE